MNESQFRLFDLTELATHCNRHVTLLRKYFALGILPEPVHTTYGKKKASRLFTRAEADAIKAMFERKGYAKFALSIRRAKRAKTLQALYAEPEVSSITPPS